MSYDTLSGTDGKKKITILGVTGSIGRNTVDVVNASSHLFNVHAVTANRNAKKLAEIAIKLGAKKAVIADSTYKEELETLLQDTPVTVQSGREAIIAVAGEKV
ncbi:MAG: 1-deoxy-D-xylulose-5-phosphate reductoisomerase, partial [Alphaproteobacteria bacterium]|nr:1-deoxy-D-xylulose-5-phosphate reductoisomerase [Alphaproteobacteria bacterium]